MAKKYFTGAAQTIAQETTITITAAAVATDYKLTIGDKTIIADGAASTSGVATNLQAAFEADKEDHPHTSRITATRTGAIVKLTADVPGVPFVVSSAATGASGTIGAPSTIVPNSGPSDVSVAANWNGGTLPGNNDEVFFRDGSQNVIYGLDGLAADDLIIHIEQTWQGKIGLDRTVFAIDVNGDSVTGVPEYREDYLTLEASEVHIGEHNGPGSPNGSSRIKIENTATGANLTTIYNSAAQASEVGKPAIRLLYDASGSNIFVRSAPGGVGIGVDSPEEAPVVGNVNVSDLSANTRVMTGEGATLANFVQNGGDNIIQADATITKITVHGGNLRTEGDFNIATLEVNAGTVYPNHINSVTGAAVTTLNLNGGTVDYTRSLEARDITTLNQVGGELRADPDVLSVATRNLPTTDVYVITVQRG